MFRRKAIDEWALDYWILQQYAKLCFRIYYRKIELINRHRIPSGQPVILAPNHQNALMDAMTLVCNTSSQNVFLARADIFKGKRMIRFLNYLNIMPIYRMRDGIENVKRNDQVFEKTVQVLNNRMSPLCLFAEGNHGDKRRLRPLVKGLFRIALQAQEQFGNQPGVKIVPVGFDYGHYQHFRSTIFVNVGEPIEVSAFYNAYAENPVTAVNQLKDAFAAAVSKLMIDIQTETYYELYMHMREVYNDNMRQHLGISDTSLAARFFADKKMISHLDAELERYPDNLPQLKLVTDKYYELLGLHKLRDWVVKKGKPSWLALAGSALFKLISLPVFAFGWLNNYLPYWFTASRITNVKDTQFHSSFKYVIGMVVFPLWYIIVAGVLAFLSAPLWLILLYFLLMPVTGILAFHYYIGIKKLISRIRYLIGFNGASMKELRMKRMEILTAMNHIINSKS
ncbi:MAG: 1-acyl-sn-glycerol-3-phosphate acyltransferase [Bacteroidales bacterium]|nr:1-acyl-sn-glycerol-3-phosphate acyltransferase [Bacteroidales bacterium]